MRAYGLTLLRLAVGAVFIAHGAQKLFGLWGGPGLDGTSRFFAGLGLTPAYPLAILVGVTEFAGGALLVAGALALWVSLALAIDMAVAIWTVHAPHGFFLSQNGVEYPAVLIAALLALALGGPGALSVDEARSQSREARARGRARARKV